MLKFPQDVKPVLLYQGAANAVACDYISLKNVNMAWILVTHTGANDTDLVLTVKEASDVSGTGVQTIGRSIPIWLDADAGTTSDLLVRQTDGTAVTIDPATQNGVQIVFQIDPTYLSAGFDCVNLGDSGGHASNICTIHAICEMAHQQASPLTVITD